MKSDSSPERALPDRLTIGEAYGPAMKITDPAEAKAYFDALVERNMRVSGNDRTKAEIIERSNLGYFSGYCDRETAERVFLLFDCSHPIFGRTRPTDEEALKAGRDAARGVMP